MAIPSYCQGLTLTATMASAELTVLFFIVSDFEAKYWFQVDQSNGGCTVEQQMPKEFVGASSLARCLVFVYVGVQHCEKTAVATRGRTRVHTVVYIAYLFLCSVWLNYDTYTLCERLKAVL
jgi:hypothetical protein